MPTHEQLAPAKIDRISDNDCDSSLVTCHMSLCFRRVCISTIQRLYSMLRSFFFSNNRPMTQGQITRPDPLRVVAINET